MCHYQLSGVKSFYTTKLRMAWIMFRKRRVARAVMAHGFAKKHLPKIMLIMLKSKYVIISLRVRKSCKKKRKKNSLIIIVVTMNISRIFISKRAFENVIEFARENICWTQRHLTNLD
jgi:hypothetical protein